MKTLVKTFAIIGIVLGGFAILGSFDNEDFYAFVGGVMFLAWGLADLALINSLKK